MKVLVTILVILPSCLVSSEVKGIVPETQYVKHLSSENMQKSLNPSSTRAEDKYQETAVQPSKLQHLRQSRKTRYSTDSNLNIWYVSDFGSNNNDCHSVSTPCKNLQMVLDRVTDGADIYVTSDTLSLNMVEGRRRRCLIDSPLSYTISHLNGTSFSFICTYGRTIDWTISDNELVKERGMPVVTINHGNFTHRRIRFDLHGLINFNHCSFNGEYVYMDIYRSEYESTLIEGNVTSFQSYMADRTFKMYKSKLKVSDEFHINVHESSCELKFTHCNLKGNLKVHASFLKKNETNFSAILLQMYHSSISYSLIDIWLQSVFISYINITSVDMFQVMLQNDHSLSKLIVHMRDSAWVNVDKGFMKLFHVLNVSIISSQMSRNCTTCILMTFHGIDGSLPKTIDYFQEFSGADFDYYHSPHLSITQTTFKFQGRIQNKIVSKGIDISFKNSTLIIEESLSFNVDLYDYFEVQNILIQCSVGKMAQRKLGQNDVIFTCDSKCKWGSQYSLQAGRLMISEKIMLTDYDYDFYHDDYYEESKLVLLSETLQATFVPSCQPCPIGVKCRDDIQILPNYWGYVTSQPSISILRCPDDYCCQGNETCKGINSCNIGRTGTLCGTCETNLTDSIFISQCVPTESCKSGLVATLFISAALVYTVILLSLSTIKNKVNYVLKKGYKICKERCQKYRGKHKKTNQQAFAEDYEAEEKGLKYMQILFYYVQDSKLFIIHLPEISIKTENVVVKFLDFSPGILAAYTEITELCLAFLSASIKVIFELSFRFLVMIFLCLAYSVQSFLSLYIKRQVIFEKLKVKLVEGFLLALLVSYQQLLTGTFTLVQCVDIKDLTVLFIQANVECYTWWQVCVLIYICISVVPLSFVISHVPFCVKDREFSVKTFILACIFPLPVVIWWQIIRTLNRKCGTRAFPKTAEVQNIPLSDVHIKEMSIIRETCSEALSHEENHHVRFAPEITVKIEEREKGNIIETDPVIENKTIITVPSVQSDLEASPEIQESTSKVISVKNKADEVGNIIEFLEQSEASGMSGVSEGISSELKQKGNLTDSKDKGVGSCDEAIVETLLKHYKPLSLFGLRFTWLGIHMFYRLSLVACRTFITEPVSRLYPMSVLVLAMTAANAIIKPYKDQRANTTATLSYIANLCMSGLNLVKAHLITYGCDTSCDHRDTVIQYMGTFETALLLYVPFAAIGVWAVYMGIQKAPQKCK